MKIEKVTEKELEEAKKSTRRGRVIPEILAFLEKEKQAKIIMERNGQARYVATQLKKLGYITKVKNNIVYVWKD